MSGLSLYVIEDNLAELLLAREEVLAAIQDPNESAVPERRAELAEIDKALAQYISLEVAKVDNYHRFFKWSNAVMAAAQQEAHEMRARATRIERAIARMKELALGAMTLANKKRVEGTAGRYLLRKGNGGQARLVIDGWDSDQKEWLAPLDRVVLPRELMDVTATMPWNVWAALEGNVEANLNQVTRLAIIPNDKRIREAMKEPCSYCEAKGTIVVTNPNLMSTEALQAGATREDQTCPHCNGTKCTIVPGARLAERGEHLEVK